MSKNVKNAGFYLGRLKDLPPSFLRAVKALQQETVSKRILPLSMCELCRSIELEYDKFSFENERKQAYAEIGELLERFSLKLVPCSIPVDLEYTGTVFVTSKPNLANDEDIAFVQDIIASGRKPRQSDYPHILRMNDKLANYNIMLRVFEALFTVAPGRLGSHQRVYLNSLLNELTLPIEGLVYLRACFTYSIEVRNCHCDYTDRKCCFKDLDADKAVRECAYLAEIGARGAVRACTCADFPFLPQLNTALRQAYAALPKDDLMLLDLPRAADDARTPVPQHIVYGHLKRSSEYRAAATAGGFPQAIGDQEADARFRTLTALFSRHSKLPKELLSLVLDKSADEKFSCIINAPDLERVKFLNFEGNRLRPAAFIHASEHFYSIDAWPMILCTSLDPAVALGKPGGERFRRYLRAADPLHPRPAEDELTLCWNLLFALIVVPSQQGCTKERRDYLYKVLRDEMPLAGEGYRAVLCTIYALNRVLFFSPDASRDGNDMMLQSGLYACPALLTLYLIRARLERSGLSQDEFMRDHAVFLRLQLAQLCSRRLSKLRRIRSPASCRPEFIVYLQKLLEAVAPEDLFTYSAGVEDKLMQLHALSAPVNRILQGLLNQPFCKVLPGALLNVKNLAPLKWCPAVLPGRTVTVENLLSSHADELVYLNSLRWDSDELLSRLLTGSAAAALVQRMRAKLLGRSFSGAAELSSVFGLGDTKVPEALIADAVSTAGLLQVPLDAALPAEIRQAIHERSFIECPPELFKDRRFMGQLGAAQLALIVYRQISPAGTASAVLAQHTSSGEPLRHKTASAFLKELEDHLKQLKPVTDAFYSRLYENTRHLDTFGYFISALKQVMRSSLQHSIFAVYERRRFEHIFTLLHQKLQGEARPGASNTAVSGSFDSLDAGVISSKLSESRQVQDVISRLVDEGEAAEAQVNAPGEAAGSGAEMADKHNLPETSPAPGTVPVPSTAGGSLSEAALRLVEAVASQKADMMDMREFEGLCLSLGFMSGDAAIEELNDRCYEYFGEPLFDSAPEEQAVYITCDLLGNFIP